MSDVKILKDIRNGDIEKFSLLYEKYFERIYRFIYSKTYNREVTEDICSSSFIKCLENIQNFKGDGSKLVSWIYQIARNQIIDFYRRDKKDKNVDDLWDLSSKEDIEIDLINRESFNYLHKNLQRLKSVERDIIILHIWEELTFREIAMNLGINEGKCKMVFYRSLKKLKVNLDSFINVVLSLKPLLLLGGTDERSGHYE